MDIGTQTRFSLNRELIKDIDEMIKEQDVSESDDNSAGINIKHPHVRRLLSCAEGTCKYFISRRSILN